MDTNQTGEMVRFIGALVGGIIGATEDHKINLKDIKYVLRIAPTVKPAFDGIGQIPGELLDMSAAEVESLGFLFCEAAQLTISDDALAVSRLGIDAAFTLAKLVEAIKNLKSDGAEASPN